MKARMLFSLILTAFFLAPMIAQAQQAPAPPPPLDDALWQSLVGEWQGWSENAMGRSEVELEVEWELQKQFLKTKVTVRNPQLEYKTVGYATKDPATGAVASSWFDSFRGVYRGTETRSGNKFTLKMEGPATIERTFELIDNKLVGTYKVVQPNGQVVEGKTELMRKVKAPKKS